MKLKLDYKHTFYIGLAFFAILMLWQVYNTYCPLILNDLHLNNVISILWLYKAIFYFLIVK